MVKLEAWDKKSNLNYLQVNENVKGTHSPFHQRRSLGVMGDKLLQLEFCNVLFSEEKPVPPLTNQAPTGRDIRNQRVFAKCWSISQP